MPSPPPPLELLGDRDWQFAAQDVWDALGALEDQVAPALQPTCSRLVGRARVALRQLTNDALAPQAARDLGSCLDGILALFHIEAPPAGDWQQYLTTAREAQAELASLLGPP